MYFIINACTIYSFEPTDGQDTEILDAPPLPLSEMFVNFILNGCPLNLLRLKLQLEIWGFIWEYREHITQVKRK